MGSPKRDTSTNEETYEGEHATSKILRNFIVTYESLPELWDSAEANYINKTKRNIALDKLVRIYEKIKPGAIRADVRRKINTLRSNYRKELKKVLISKESATDEVYKPTSWVFYALKFLHKYAQPAYANVELSQDPHDKESQTATSQKDNTTIKGDREEQDPLFSVPSRSSIIPPTKKLRVVGPTDKEEQLLSLACKYLQESNVPEANCPTIVKVWGEKLKVLDEKQRLFAEKAINDVLFEASLGNLHRYSVKINEDPYNQQSVQSFTLTPFTSPLPVPAQQYPQDDKL